MITSIIILINTRRIQEKTGDQKILPYSYSRQLRLRVVRVEAVLRAPIFLLMCVNSGLEMHSKNLLRNQVILSFKLIIFDIFMFSEIRYRLFISPRLKWAS